ncbi:MAG: hypothetical protein ACYC4J_02470 [Gemmatimonadaceae bacterium]
MVPATNSPPDLAARARHVWLAPERQRHVRNALFGLLLFVALAVGVFHSVAARRAGSPALVQKLRVLGVMTWIYTLVQLLDTRFYRSRFVRRRSSGRGLPGRSRGQPRAGTPDRHCRRGARRPGDAPARPDSAPRWARNLPRTPRIPWNRSP